MKQLGFGYAMIPKSSKGPKQNQLKHASCIHDQLIFTWLNHQNP